MKKKLNPLAAGFIGGFIAVALLSIVGAQQSVYSWATAKFVSKGPVISADSTANNIDGSTTSAKVPLVVQQRTGASVDAFSVYAAGSTRFKVDTNGCAVLNATLAFRRNTSSSTSASPTVSQLGSWFITPSAAFTFNLPAISTLPTGGSLVVIKNVAGTGATRNCTIDANASETIDGATTVTLTAAYWYAILMGDSTGWYVIASSG